MKTFKHIVLAFAAILMVASCAIDEMWQGSDIQDEERVLTFKPRFEDFEAATKVIGDGSEVDKLLVQVYDKDENLVLTKDYDVSKCAIQEAIKIPFFKNNKYKVYFWAYNSSKPAYKIAEGGLKYGVTINYPESTESLDFDSLEYLDAFYAVQDVDFSSAKNIKKDNVSISLTRPFAQVNLVANADELLAVNAVAVSFKMSVSTSFIPGGDVLTTEEKTFTFACEENFKDNDSMDEVKNLLYLGTLYIPVSGTAVSAEITLIDANGNNIRYSSSVEIPLAGNNRTNLVFEGIKPSWDDTLCDDETDVPSQQGDDDWIHITKPEELIALLIFGAKDASYHICNDLDFTGMTEISKNKIDGSAKFSNIRIDAEKLGGGSYMLKNIKGVKAIFASAEDVHFSNITVDGAEVSGNTHVGVLVNILKGSSSFTDVNITNSSATTTSGAAGGMVGYIVRKTETDRSESMAISFKDCQVISTSATGKESAGKFVGKFSGYDNGETLTFTGCSTSEASASADNASPYVEGNEGAWLADAGFSTFDSWLGDEAYYRGVVTFDGVRFQPKWDGEKTIDPLLANKTYDAGTTAGTDRYVVYSAFDLAGLRKKTPSPAALYLMTNVDMFGQGEDGKFFVPNEFMSACTSTDDKVFNSFTSISTLEGFNNTIYGLKIEHLKQGSTSAAFIGTASGTTYHQNINFDNCCVVSTHKDVKSDAKAYGAIVCCNPSGTYTQKYVKANNCKVYALQKVGTLSSRVSGNSVLSNNSISNCYIENYDCRISETFTSGKIEIYDNSVTVSADFYPAGEVGGMYGFIQDVALISDCSVINTVVHALGQADIEATIKGSGILGYLAVLAVKGFGYYLVPGRHVSTMIGDIRLTNGDIEISNCSVDADSKCTNTYNSHNSTYTYIGQAYTVAFVDDGGTFKINNNQVTIADCNKNTKL